MCQQRSRVIIRKRINKKMAKNKKPKISSTQKHLDIAEIRDGVVIMKDGSVRVVLMVSSLNFALKSELEQTAIVNGFRGFLNALNFPLQIVMQSRVLNLDPYLQKLANRSQEIENPLLAKQVLEYRDFVSKLIDVANIMRKNFYVVVPYSSGLIQKAGLIKKLRSVFSRGDRSQEVSNFEVKKRALVERANVVAGGLGSLGLKSAQLDTEELIQLFYGTYNPNSSATNKLPPIDEGLSFGQNTGGQNG